MKCLVCLLLLAASASFAQNPSTYPYRSYAQFGDSITWGCCDNNGQRNPNRYSTLLGNALGLVPANDNINFSGETVADDASQIYAVTTNTNHQLFTQMIFTNDYYQQYYQNVSQQMGGIAVVQSAQLAEAAWLALLPANKTTAQALQAGGSCNGWAPSPYGDWGFGLSDNGTSFDWKRACSGYVSGSTIYVAYTAMGISSNSGSVGPFLTSTGHVTIVVDGKAVSDTTENVACKSTGTKIGGFLDGPCLLSMHGRSYLPQLVRVAGLQAGPHKIEVENSSGDGTGASQIILDWIGGNGGADTPGAPTLELLPLPKMIYEDSTTDQYRYAAATAQVAQQLASDGLNVLYADIRAYQGANPVACLTPDQHPNDCGHAEIFAGAIARLGQALTGSASGDLDGNYPTPNVKSISGGPLAAPGGSCSVNGQWVFSQDGHVSFCSNNTWQIKL